MATPMNLRLDPDQVAELMLLRDNHPKPYVRERAAAILKVASGWSVRRVALHGLLRPRRPETVGDWINRYLSVGAGGLEVAAGRGRKIEPSEGETCGRDGERGAMDRLSFAPPSSAEDRPSAASQRDAGSPPGGRKPMVMSGRSRDSRYW